MTLSPDQLARMRALWENSPELTAVAIGERFGVTKGVVIGHADRRGWVARPAPVAIANWRAGTKPAAPAPSTIFTRLDALHATFDQVLAASRAVVDADRQKRAAAELRKAAA